MKLYNFAEYEVVKDTNKSNKYYYIISSLLVIGIIIILCKFNFKTYLKLPLVKQDNDYALVVDIDTLLLLEENNTIYINQKKYNYTISHVDENYTNIDNKIYQTIYLNPINYSSKTKVINGYFLKSNKTILKMVIEFIQGGL